MQQAKKPRPTCPVCGKPHTKFNPLPHDHSPITVKAVQR